MRTLKELTAADGSTHPSSGQMSEFQNIFMSPDVVRFAEEQRFFMQAVQEYTDIIGTKDKSLKIPISTAHQDISARTAANYSTERTWTTMSKLDTLEIEPAWILGGVNISKELVETSRVDLVKEAKFILVEDIAEDIETAVTEAIDTKVTSNVVWGGSASDPTQLSSGNKITTDLVADAIELIGSKWVPSLLFIRSAQQSVFYKSSQFTNAAEYGSDRVVLKGEIGEYLGLKIIVTDLCQHYASGDTDKGIDASWNVAGTSCQLVGFSRSGRKPVAFVWKEKPTVDYEYSKKFTAHYIMSDVAYKADVSHEKACCLIKVSDA